MEADMGGSALEQFCALAKSSNGRACGLIVSQVLSTPSVFVFGELLAMPNLQALRGTENEPHLRQLEMFAYGTYSDYRSAPEGSLPALKPAALHKLRMLSILALAQSRREVPYSLLQSELDISSIRGVEDIIIDTIYAGLIQGRLDQKAGALRIKYAMPRDVKVEDVPSMIESLDDWSQRAESMLAALDESLKRAGDTMEEEAQMAIALSKEVSTSSSSGRRGGKVSAAGRDATIDADGRRGSKGAGKRYRARGALEHRQRSR
jgi:COP9 signalosome complex subunit 7